jgi:hypothetical protein
MRMKKISHFSQTIYDLIAPLEVHPAPCQAEAPRDMLVEGGDGELLPGSSLLFTMTNMRISVVAKANWLNKIQ